MKKFIFIYLLSIAPLFGTETKSHDSLMQRSISWLLQREHMQDPSEEIKEKVHQICVESGIKNPESIAIKQATLPGQRGGVLRFDFADSDEFFGYGKTIFLAWFFAAMSPEKQKFLIKQQLAHLQHHNPTKRNIRKIVHGLISAFGTVVLAYLITYKVAGKRITGKETTFADGWKNIVGASFSLKEFGAVAAISSLLYMFSAIALNKLGKEQELYADRLAASDQQLAEAGFNLYAIEQEEQNWFLALFQDKPSSKERLAQLREIANQYQKEAVAA